MLNHKHFSVFAFTISAILSGVFPQFTQAYEVDTHSRFQTAIAQDTTRFNLDKYLKEKLNLSSGVTTTFKGNSVYEWMAEGGEKEDGYSMFGPINIRPTNHFHNPLAPSLEQAGFTGIWGSGFLKGESAVLWAQKDHGIYDDYSWLDARRYYLNALISPEAETREQKFAQTFRAIGQVMHLLQDMSVPQHVRDDGHYIKAFEAWLSNRHTNGLALVKNGIANPVFFDIAQLSHASPFYDAPIPIARLFDSNLYTGSNPNVTTGTDIGLAEYTNANFVSDDTLVTSGTFPYPNHITSVTAADCSILDPANPGTMVLRPYYIKDSDGENKPLVTCGDVPVSGYRLAAEDYFTVYRKEFRLDKPDTEILPIMDDYVYTDYATLLIPRAVGYSASLLQYFFRGDISMTVAPDNAGKYIVENLSDEAMSGTFSLYADDADGNRTIVEGSTITMDLPAHGLQRIEAFLPPIAEDAAVGYLLVFVGTLGQEEGAVTAVKFDPPPPVPIVVQEDPAPGWNRYQVVNNSDMTISGLLTLRYVSNETGQLVVKPVANVSWPVTLAPGEQADVKAEAFAPLVDAEYPDQYQLVFKGTVNGESESLLYNRLTIPAIKPGWVEEWNSGLTGSHLWLSTDIDYPTSSLGSGITTSYIDSGRLVKENTRTVTTKAARSNETTMRVPIISPSGQYCLNNFFTSCVPYNFGEEFPLPITPNTVLRVKIDELFVSSEVLQYDTCSITGYGQFQGVRFQFDNGVSLSFSQEGQEPPDYFQVYVTPGVEVNLNIFEAFAAAGRPFVEPVNLKLIHVVQSLGNLCSPSTIEHQQRIKVDYIRMEEDPNYGGY